MTTHVRRMNCKQYMQVAIFRLIKLIKMVNMPQLCPHVISVCNITTVYLHLFR